MKTNGAGSIILPNQDGVADLDIRRVQKEMTKDTKPLEMHGHMPAKLIPKVVRELKRIIGEVERGEVSSVCLISITPKSEFEDAGSCFIGGVHDQMDKIHELFHISLMERMEREGTPPDEAG
jgi:hypothetical protein